MLIAGLYDTVTYEPTPSDPHPAPISTFTILTTTPCESLKFLHDRMPVILRTEEDVETWLDCRDGWTDKVAKLCKPYEGKLEWLVARFNVLLPDKMC
jgi:putative SOS response-associated peptidase YedK